jgi:hypothetical protein
MDDSLTRTELCHLADTLKPTLLIHYNGHGSDAKRDLDKIIRLPSRAGVYSIRKGKAFEGCLSKVVATQSPIDGLDSTGTFVSIDLPYGIRPKRALRNKDLDLLAERFVPQLLAFRLQNYVRVQSLMNSCEIDCVSSTELLVRTWGAPMLGDSSLEEKLRHALEDRASAERLERETKPEWIVLKALLHMCHRHSSEELFVATLTEPVNFFEDALGLKRSLPRKVGPVLKLLGLRTKRLGATGRGLVWDDRMKWKVHQLAFNHGLTRGHLTVIDAIKSGNAGLPCSLCDLFGLNTSEDGKQLKTLELFNPRVEPRRSRFHFSEGT